MASLIPGYEYDIFISYRQKDNKGEQWVSEFVESLKTELESTFKEEISVYFDINPHDGLLETHEVGESLNDKLKCVIFIPIISRTYCDPKSFAWEHEFKAFVEQTSRDQFGLKVKLPNGNVASRVLPVRIHDLSASDIKLFESVTRGTMRSIDFVYKETGVNRQLRAKDDDLIRSPNQILYRDQVNKAALAIREIIESLKSPIIKSKPAGIGIQDEEIYTGDISSEEPVKTKQKRFSFLRNRGILVSGIIGIIAILAVIIFSLNRSEGKNIPVNLLLGKWEGLSYVCDTIVNDKIIGYSFTTYEPGEVILEFSNPHSGYVYTKEGRTKFAYSITAGDTLVITFPNQAPLYHLFTIKETTLTWQVTLYREINWPKQGDIFKIIGFYTTRRIK